MDIIRGKVWKFGDDVDTDAISPSGTTEVRKHVLEVLNPRFPVEVQPGDVIVAGSNFGCGSSRETAPSLLMSLGIAAVVAESFGRIFFRNAIAIGLPIIACTNVADSFAEGNELELDMDNARVTNVTSGKNMDAQPLPGEMREILSKGGIIPILKEIAAAETG